MSKAKTWRECTLLSSTPAILCTVNLLLCQWWYPAFILSKESHWDCLLLLYLNSTTVLRGVCYQCKAIVRLLIFLWHWFLIVTVPAQFFIACYLCDSITVLFHAQHPAAVWGGWRAPGSRAGEIFCSAAGTRGTGNILHGAEAVVFWGIASHCPKTFVSCRFAYLKWGFWLIEAFISI